MPLTDAQIQTYLTGLINPGDPTGFAAQYVLAAGLYSNMWDIARDMIDWEIRQVGNIQSFTLGGATFNLSGRLSSLQDLRKWVVGQRPSKAVSSIPVSTLPDAYGDATSLVDEFGTP